MTPSTKPTFIFTAIVLSITLHTLAVGLVAIRFDVMTEPFKPTINFLGNFILGQYSQSQPSTEHDPWRPAISFGKIMGPTHQQVSTDLNKPPGGELSSQKQFLKKIFINDGVISQQSYNPMTTPSVDGIDLDPVEYVPLRFQQ